MHTSVSVSSVPGADNLADATVEEVKRIAEELKRRAGGK
ncbi:hypothetical protein FDG2_1883 [Candidatus Protofrankia californiensis]|uniref:Uncharacterized protein n=1 Tax=Candidatus Protofrankia californiensis TaxID=1839754 RepID=A0A1C3NWJ4_9ACTN|nr:hypothetical protein FDG2_1883 [Candidatus Protofrankia californiensis]